MNDAITKAEEILAKFKNRSDHYADQDYDESQILRAMKEYAIYCCEKQREICAENAETITDTSTSYVYTSVNSGTIINSPLPDFLQ